MFLTRKSPKLLCIIISLINIVMVFFVYNGATHNSSAYSSLYLVEYQFENKSDIYSMIDRQYSAQHDSASLSDFSLQVGYIGLCLKFMDETLDKEGDNGLICGYTSDIIDKYNDQVPSFSLTSSNSTNAAGLELFDLVKTFQENVMKKVIFIVLLIFLVALIVLQVYSLLGFLPFQKYVLILISITLFSSFIILNIILIWLLVADSTMTNTGYETSLKILTVSSSNKPQSILWAVFALLIVESIFYAYEFGRLGKKKGESKVNGGDAEQNAGGDYSYGYHPQVYSYNKNNNNHKYNTHRPNGSVMSSISTLRGVL